MVNQTENKEAGLTYLYGIHWDRTRGLNSYQHNVEVYLRYPTRNLRRFTRLAWPCVATTPASKGPFWGLAWERVLEHRSVEKRWRLGDPFVLA